MRREVWDFVDPQEVVEIIGQMGPGAAQSARVSNDKLSGELSLGSLDGLSILPSAEIIHCSVVVRAYLEKCTHNLSQCNCIYTQYRTYCSVTVF